MSDHAKTVARLCAPMTAEAYEALDALVAERDELLRSLASMEASRVDVIQQERMETAHFVARAEAAEAERDAAKASRDYYQRCMISSETRVTELEAAAQGVLDCTEHHDGCPKCIGILRAALADKEGT